MPTRSAQIAGIVLGLICTLILPPATAQAAPPQFGVEIQAGTGAGFTPYLRNEVLTEVDRTQTDAQDRFLLEPSLADVETGAGTSVAVRLVATNIAAGLSLRWFDLSGYSVHHVGQRSISQTRVRPDGSVDDSGVGYRQLDPPLEQPIDENDQDQLFVFGLTGDYRFFWPGEALDVFVPVGGGLALTYVTGEASPYRLGLEANSGVGATVSLSDNIALVLDARLHGLITTHYGRRSDAARRAVAVGESTEETFFSTLLYGTASVGLQFTIR